MLPDKEMFEALMAVNIKTADFWGVMLCCLIDGY
jgi:hypothetical protein